VLVPSQLHTHRQLAENARTSYQLINTRRLFNCPERSHNASPPQFLDGPLLNEYHRSQFKHEVVTEDLKRIITRYLVEVSYRQILVTDLIDQAAAVVS
jgi:hypothetical protein